MYDRALQALVKLGLEPEWEARFEPNSYGFRPGREGWYQRFERISYKQTSSLLVRVPSLAKFLQVGKPAQRTSR